MKFCIGRNIRASPSHLIWPNCIARPQRALRPPYENMSALVATAQLCYLAALSGPVCTRPALHAPVVSRAPRRVVCAAEAEAEANDEGRDSGVRGARIIGFAGGAFAGGCAKLRLLTKPSLLSCTCHYCTAPRGTFSSSKMSSNPCLSPRHARHSPHASALAGDAAPPPQVAGPALSELSKTVESGGANIKVSGPLCCPARLPPCLPLLPEPPSERTCYLHSYPRCRRISAA